MASKADAGGINKLIIPAAKAVASNARDAIKWFVDRVKDRLKSNPKIAADTVPSIGHMYLFRYDAKGKDTLPFWDAAPLVIPIEFYKDGFLGINLHYLPPNLRAKLVAGLSKVFMQGQGERRYMKISYEKLAGLSRLAMFQPCLKRYLFSHVRSRFQRIPHAEWQNAVMLPSANWKGASSSAVYKDSLKRF